MLLEPDLPSSLRTMGNEKPLQGNRGRKKLFVFLFVPHSWMAVADAFESLQRRNIVAVTKKQKKHKKLSGRFLLFLDVCSLLCFLFFSFFGEAMMTS